MSAALLWVALSVSCVPFVDDGWLSLIVVQQTPPLEDAAWIVEFSCPVPFTLPDIPH